MVDGVFLTWEEHRRTRGIATPLGTELVEIVTHRRGWGRYVELLPRTIRFLLVRRPRLLIVQCPSIVLGALVLALRPLLGYGLIVDAHNEAVQPHSDHGRFVKAIARALLRHADRTIVTNPFLAQIVEKAGGRASVLPDKLPAPPEDLPDYDFEERNGTKAVLIATFAKDEPVAEIFEAVGQLEEPVWLFVTGNPSRYRGRRPVPENVVFTGFLPDRDYWTLLRSADMIIDLTTYDNCLVCGAYEAVAVATPAILSDNPATREYFRQGAVYTDATVDDITTALQEMAQGLAGYREDTAVLRDVVTAQWPILLTQVVESISQLTDR